MSGISPEKLKGWRLRKGWTLEALASAMTQSGHAISKAALGQFEKGDSKPKAATLRALANVFGVRASDLMESDFELHFLGFRSLAALSKTNRERIQAVMTSRAESRHKLCVLSGCVQKEWSGTCHRVDDVAQADEIALNIRMVWDLGLDAIGGLAAVVERNGGEVIEIADDPKFSGLSAFSHSGVPYLAIQRRERDGARQRMDLAHELAHLVLDPDSKVDAEGFARRFAGAFLLPREVVVGELGNKRRNLNLQELKALKLKYGVSVQAWVRRASDCGVISPSTYRSLAFRISAAGMRADEGAPYITPEALDRDFRLAARCVTEGALTVEDAAQLAGVPRELLDDRPMKPESKHRPNLRMLSREQRKELAEAAAQMSGAAYRDYPDDLLPDGVDFHED